VAATGVCYRYGVDKSRIGVIGSVCIIPGSIDVDGLAIANPSTSIEQINRISFISLVFFKKLV